MRKSLGILVLLTAMASANASPPSAPSSLPEDAAVIQAVIDALCKDADQSTMQPAGQLSSEALLLRPDSPELQMGPSDLDEVAEQQLVQRVEKASKLPGRLKDCSSLRLTSEAEVNARISSQARIPIDQMPPSCSYLMHLSLPGYSADGNTALVYLTMYCASLCGEGEYVILRKIGAGWSVAKRERAYIS